METKTYKGIKAIAAEVRAELKKTFPECKFSVKIDRYSMGQSLEISLMSAPFEVFGGIFPALKAYSQLNHFTLQENKPERRNFESNGTLLTQEAWDVLSKAVEIGQRENWDNSEPMTDYYDVNYAFHISIGRWDKPFEKISR